MVDAKGHKKQNIINNMNDKKESNPDPELWEQSGKYKIMNENGEVTGNININNYFKLSHYEPEHYIRPDIGNRNLKRIPRPVSGTDNSNEENENKIITDTQSEGRNKLEI